MRYVFIGCAACLVAIVLPPKHRSKVGPSLKRTEEVASGSRLVDRVPIFVCLLASFVPPPISTPWAGEERGEQSRRGKV